MSASFIFEPWVYTDNDEVLVNYNWSDEDNNEYNGSEFVGNLFVCKESCDSWYRRLSNKWCDFYEDLKDFANKNDLDTSLADPWKSVCKMYSSLYLGTLAYIILEGFGMLCLIFWTCFTVIYIKKQRCLCVGFVFAALTWVFHCVAFLAYVGVTTTKYDGKCDEFPDDGSNPVLCAGAALAYVLAVALFISIFVVFYMVTACVLNRKNKLKKEKKVEDKLNVSVEEVINNENDKNKVKHETEPMVSSDSAKRK